MTYNNKLVREVLKKVEYACANKWSDDKILNAIKDLPGTEKDKKLLIENCKIYLFITQAFESDKSNINYAIDLASKYVLTKRDTSDLIKQKLVTMNIKAGYLRDAEIILSKLEKKDPDDERNCAKHTILLMRKNKFEEALEYVSEKEKIHTTDPVLFNLHYNILMELNKKQEILDLLCNIGNIDIGNDPIIRKYRINKFVIFLRDIKTIQGSNKDKAIQEICKKLRYERKKDKKKQEKDNNDNKDDRILSNEEIENNIDNMLVKNINNMIVQSKDDRTYQKLKEKVEKINNRIIKYIMDFQVDFAYGRTSRDIIVMKVGKYIRENKSQMSEAEKTVLDKIFLRNFLKSRDASFYIHDKWVDFQKNNFYKLQNIEKKSENTNTNANVNVNANDDLNKDKDEDNEGLR